MIAYLEYITQETNKKVHVMALSLGATGVLAGLADPNIKRANYLNSMIAKFYAFAPVIFTVSPQFLIFQNGSDVQSLKYARCCGGLIQIIVWFILRIFRLHMYTAMPEKVNMKKVKFWNSRVKFNYHTKLKKTDRTNKMNCMEIMGNYKAFCPHGQSIHIMKHIC